MSTQKKTLSSQDHHEKKSSNQHKEVNIAVDSFVRLYDARAKFFNEAFIKKVKEGNRKALAELQLHPFPPTPMDLRLEFARCLKANVPDQHFFVMKDGKRYSMHELRKLVPEWSSLAEKALMASAPALADKLMSPAQWNAKSAFEVTFVNALNELREIKKAKQVRGGFDHYLKWIINPLNKAIEQVKAVSPPNNSLIGYGDRISLGEALATAMNMEKEFQKVLAEKTR